MPGKNFISNSAGYIAEYFLGTETHKYYNNQRSFYREFLEGNALKHKLRELKEKEVYEITAGRAVFDAVSLAALASSILMKNPLYFLFFSEAGRCLCMSVCYYTRKSDRIAESITKKIHQFRVKAECLDSEGEEWKNSGKCQLRKELDDIMDSSVD